MTLRHGYYHDIDLSSPQRSALPPHLVRRVLTALRRGWDDANYLNERLLDRPSD